MKRLSSRLATRHDSTVLAQFVNAAYRGESSKPGWTTEADLLGGQRTDQATLQQTIETPDSHILMFFDEDILVGCVYLQKRPQAAYLGMLTVKPELQASGLGRTILQSAEEYAQTTLSARRIEMTVITVRHELIDWYERRGYRNTGKLEPFPYGDEKFGLPKVTDLKFVVLEKVL